MITAPYIGRFAPSPTGPLHFGSLVAAVASYCDAKAHNGSWLLRMEDLDKPREVTGAADLIINTLTSYGFEWDGDIVYQSQRDALYAIHLQKLQTLNVAYPCTCSRKDIDSTNPQRGIEGVIYPRTCLLHPEKQNPLVAWRVKTTDTPIHFEDVVQGLVTQDISHEIGDFVVLRADMVYAYQLAVVTDDALQGVTHIVRGADLLHSTPRQIYLQQLLGLTTPTYAHIPIICNRAGEKLSKQTFAEAIHNTEKSQMLVKALAYLNQSPPKKLAKARVNTILAWAVDHWQIKQLPQHKLTLD